MSTALKILIGLALLLAVVWLAVAVSYERQEAEHHDQLAKAEAAYSAALQSAEEEAADLKPQLRCAGERRVKLEDKVHAASEKFKRQGFELVYIKEKGDGSRPFQPSASSGKVLVASDGDNVFVISLGKEDGVESGFQYIVSRGSKYIAVIQITDVQGKQAAGRAIKSLSKGEIKRGDTVMNGR